MRAVAFCGAAGAGTGGAKSVVVCACARQVKLGRKTLLFAHRRCRFMYAGGRGGCLIELKMKKSEEESNAQAAERTVWLQPGHNSQTLKLIPETAGRDDSADKSTVTPAPHHDHQHRQDSPHSVTAQ